LCAEWRSRKFFRPRARSEQETNREKVRKPCERRRYRRRRYQRHSSFPFERGSYFFACRMERSKVLSPPREERARETIHYKPKKGRTNPRNTYYTYLSSILL
jgi:hypothetical protein